MQRIIYINFIISFIFFTSCLSYKQPSISGVQNFQIKKISKEGMQSEIAVKIKNPNDFGFYIYSGKADIYVGKIPLGEAKLSKKVYVPAKSMGVYNLLVSTSFEKITMQDIIKSMSLSDIQKIKVDGYIIVGKFLYRKKIKANYEGDLLNSINFNFTAY